MLAVTGGVEPYESSAFSIQAKAGLCTPTLNFRRLPG